MIAGSWSSHLWHLKKQQLLRSKAPILVGPWLGEVGFEALYWIPFLDQLVADGVDRSRLIAISRGGASCWYQTAQGIEVYAMRSPQDVRVEMRQRLSSKYTSTKQLRWTPFERQIVKDAAETLKLRRYLTLHPSWMYHCLAPYYESQEGLAWLQRRTQWHTIPAPKLPDDLRLPEQFVAVRFYLRPTFYEQGMALVGACVQQLALQLPVIMLQSDFFADDHQDIQVSGTNITQLRDLVLLTPENNLAVQSAVLARSTAFVGTYGGFAQLALRLGRSVISFYDAWNATMITHKHLSDTLAQVMGVTWQVVGLKDFGLLQAAMPTLQQKAKVHPNM